MPSLAGAVTRFSSKIMRANGQIIKGYFRPPQSVRSSFDGLFTPRFMLAVPPQYVLTVGETVMDQQGTYYLCGSWSPSMLRDSLVAQTFVLFECNVYIPWARSATTIEPISGLKRSTPAAFIKMVRGLKEPLTQVQDGMDVAVSKDRVLVGEPVQLEDTLDDERVLRAEIVNGLTYCEVV